MTRQTVAGETPKSKQVNVSTHNSSARNTPHTMRYGLTQVFCNNR